MKQIYLQLFFILCGIAAYGQDVLNFKMCDVYKGKVKSIVMTYPEAMRSEMGFSIDGKSQYMKNSAFRVDYDWNDDKEVKLTISNSQEKQEFYIYINDYRNDYYDYDLGEGNVKIWFRKNGSLDKKEMTQNGNKAYTTYYYQKESDMFPYKIENRMGTQSQTIYVNVERFDSEGNAIVYSQTCNGTTIQVKRTIEYYK